MITRAALLTALLLFPAAADATTEADLRSRIIIDGDLSDFETDELILGRTTNVRERLRDSRWGEDNDLDRIFLTWDNHNLYIGVEAVTVNTELMLFLDTMCGGVSDLSHVDPMPRNITLGALPANLVLAVTRLMPEPRMLYIDCANPLNWINADRVESVYLQDSNTLMAGALEIAIPWEVLGSYETGESETLVPQPGQTIAIAAAITSGPGGGVGDAGPDPNVLIENDSTRVAVLNNHIRLPLDSDGNGILDVGVSPQAASTFANAGMPTESQVLPVSLVIEEKVFAPDNGEVVRFRTSLVPDTFSDAVYLTARVYSSSGRLIRHILESEPRDLGVSASWDEWDGRDDYGNVVPGGIYVLAVSGASAPNAPATPVKASVAVIR